MSTLTLRHVVVGAAKADFVKHSIRVSLDLSLNDETLALRSKLAFLAMEKESITVTLESAQLPLFGGDAELQNIAEAEAARVESVTPSANGESVTVSAQAFEHAAETISRVNPLHPFQKRCLICRVEREFKEMRREMEHET